MVWAILRRDPRRANFEFEDHPAINVVYTLSLETHRNRIIPNFISKGGEFDGITFQNINARKRFIAGAIKKGKVLE